jgi:hypothetical protein
LAVAYEHVSVIQLLLEKGADIESKDVEGRTALSRAAFSAEASMVELLLDLGAKIEYRDKNGQTPLSLTLGSKGYYEDQISEKVMLLVSRGADLLSKDNKGLMPLDHAKKDKGLRKRLPSIISFLKEKTAELGYVDDDLEELAAPIASNLQTEMAILRTT